MLIKTVKNETRFKSYMLNCGMSFKIVTKLSQKFYDKLFEDQLPECRFQPGYRLLYAGVPDGSSKKNVCIGIN